MASRRDIFDLGAKPPPKARPTADIPDDAWTPRAPAPADDDDEQEPPSFDEAADDIQRQAAANRSHYLHELELLAVAWRADLSLAGTSARAVMHLLALAGGGPEKRPRPPLDAGDGADTDVPEWLPRVKRDG